MNKEITVSIGKEEKKVFVESVVYDEERRFIVITDEQEYIFYKQDNQWHYSADTELKDEWLKALGEQLDAIENEKI